VFQIPHLKKKKKPSLVRVCPGRPGPGSTHRVARVWPGCYHSRSFVKPGPVQPPGRPDPGSTRRAGPGLITMPLKTYIIVNVKTCEISREGTHKLIWTFNKKQIKQNIVCMSAGVRLESKFGLQISHDVVVLYEFEPFSCMLFIVVKTRHLKAGTGRKYIPFDGTRKKKKGKKKAAQPKRLVLSLLCSLSCISMFFLYSLLIYFL